jgi:creatinine amidohydrolase
VFAALSRRELSASIPDATIVVPLGSTEQHGPHLPVAVDTTIISAIAHRAASDATRRGTPVLVTPTLPFGFAEHHVVFGGTVSIDVRTYVDVLFAIGRSLCRQGVRKLVFLNGHGGNDLSARAVVDRLAFEVEQEVTVAAASYWDIARTVLEDTGLSAGLVPGHAGHFETSLMLVLAPELVRLESRERDESSATPIGIPEPFGATVRRPGQWESSDGRTDDASLASAELGERLLGAIVHEVAEFLVQFHNSAN